MCGITGVFNLTNKEPIDTNLLHEANNVLYHRGPDEEGIFVKHNIGLAMRRLSIIDVVGGHQPISNEDGAVRIIYNGEMYNYRDLRVDLISFGHQFSTNSDTEVILHAYEQWGIEGCLARLRGMYAFAIWDSRLQSLFLCRDRMGVKPLYFTEYDGRLYFASEICSILVHTKMSRMINLEALDAFLTVGFVPNPHTIFKGISKLPPAHYLMAKNEKLSVYKYWELFYEPARYSSEAEIVEEFYELLSQSVEMRMMSEVPLGALLSGGIDSATIVALAQQATKKKVKTISVGFESASHNEAESALATAQALKTDHYPISFTDDSMEEYPQALYHLEEPLAEPVFVSEYIMHRACRQQGLTVVLTGEGADELLAGYYWHNGEIRVRPFLKLPYFLRTILAKALCIYSDRATSMMAMGRVLEAGCSTVQSRFQTWLTIGDTNLKDCLLSSDVKETLKKNDKPPLLTSWTKHIIANTGRPDYDQMLWLQSRTRMIDDINHSLDRMSMANSVEARVPFLDHKLWEFCATIPFKLKLKGKYFKLTEKYLLREAVRRLIPEETRLRKKRGLTTPYAMWIAKLRLPDWAEIALSKDRLRKTGLFDPAAVFRLRRENQEGAYDKATLLMAVLAIQTWSYIFLESSQLCNRSWV
jgi:asparagine synthase (glutamine-hydrolysing)